MKRYDRKVPVKTFRKIGHMRVEPLIITIIAPMTDASDLSELSVPVPLASISSTYPMRIPQKRVKNWDMRLNV